MAISSYEWRMFHNAPPSDSQSFEVLETDDGVRILCIHNIPSTATSLHVICISLVWGLRASNTSFAGNWKCESSADLLEVLAIQGAHFSCSSHEIKWREKSCKSFLFFCFRESHQGSPHYSPFSFFLRFFCRIPSAFHKDFNENDNKRNIITVGDMNSIASKKTEKYFELDNFPIHEKQALFFSYKIRSLVHKIHSFPES